MSDFCHLHVHSYYSLMDGLNSPKELMQAAKDNGQTSIAFTDHGTLSSHREAQEAAVELGMKPILGVEAYFSPTDRFDRRDVKKRDDNTSLYHHMTILAKNQQGWENLSKLSEIAWREGYYYKPRMDWEILDKYGDGLVVLSGCMSGLVAKAIEKGNDEDAHKWLRLFKDRFGEDYYIEMMSDNPIELSTKLLEYADMYNIKPVATADCHFAKPEERAAEEAMLILSTSPKFEKGKDYESTKNIKDVFERYNAIYPERPISFEKLDLYVRTRANIEEAFQSIDIDRPDMYESTMEIADKIGSYEYPKGLDLLPKPKNMDPDQRMRELVYQGLCDKGHGDQPEYFKQADEEMEVIFAKNFSTYHLVVRGMVKEERELGGWMSPGRGSAAGSVCVYALDITRLDPLKYGLLFFRYINPERNDYPDIDCDFEDRSRKRIKESLSKKFKYVASISTYSYFRDKNVVKSAARVFRVPLGDVNKAMKNINPPPGADFFALFEKSEKGREFIKAYPEVMPLAKKLRERITSAGMHASGVVVSNRPLEGIIPLETRTDPKDKVSGRLTVITGDMNQAESIGLIKLDVLGLKTLTVLHDAADMVKERHGKAIDPYDIPLDDKNVYADLSAGYTAGVFQCEQPAYTQLLKDMEVSNFEDLAASNALVRPGAKNTVGEIYINRKKGVENVKYAHKIMKPITENTYGVIIYQEQVMQAMTELAGMSMATADKVRKIIGKKKDVSEFEQYRAEFVEGASQHISKSAAENLWKTFEAHAGYSFNRSHAIAYSMVSYWSAWFKRYYPLEYMTALLQNEEDKDKTTDYLIETKRLGIKVLLPNVNASKENFSIEGDGIRFGLGNVKYISETTANPIMEHRPYKSFADLVEKAETKGSGINARQVGALRVIGAATFPDNPRTGNESQYYYEYLGIPKFASKPLPVRTMNLVRPLDEYDEKDTFIVRVMVKKIKTGTGWSRVEVVDETGSAGIFHNEDTQIEPGQLYFMLVANNRVSRYVPADKVWEALATGTDDSFINYLIAEETTKYVTEGYYYVLAFDRRKTKRGDWMATLTLINHEDEIRGVVVFPKEFSKAYGKAKEGKTIEATFKKLDDGGICLGDIY